MREKEDSERNGFDALAKKLEAALGKSAEDPAADGTLHELVQPSFMDTIKKSPTAVVEFYTTYCPYCKQMEPVLEELAADYITKVFFGKVNIESVEGAAEKFNIAGVPLIIAFKKGNSIGRVEGLRDFEVLDDWIDSIQKGLRPMTLEPGQSTKTTY